MAEFSDHLRRWGKPPWRRADFAAPGALPRHLDVAIIGGGLTGVSAAYHLARAGVRTALFEADVIGSGASGRTGGLVLEGTAAGPREGADDCLPFLNELVARLDLDCDLHLPGCWEIAHREEPPPRALPWTDAGMPLAIMRTVPGGIVEPGALTLGLAAAAVAAGAQVYEECKVTELRLAATPILKVKHEDIAAAQVIVALNAWTLALLPGFAAMESALTYACVTEPLPEDVLVTLGLAARIPFYTVDTPYLWGRVCANRSIIFGAGLTYSEHGELEDIRVTDSEPVATLTRLIQRVNALHPALAAVRITAGWGGPVAFREGLMPLLTRHPGHERVLVAGAYAGHGIAFGVRAGARMAAAICADAPLPSWGRA